MVQGRIPAGINRDSSEREPGKVELEPELGIELHVTCRLQKSGVKLTPSLPLLFAPFLPFSLLFSLPVLQK